MEFEHNGVNYTRRAYIDPVYVGMDPMECIQSNDADVNTTIGLRQLCFVKFGTTLGLPVFNHYGAAGAIPASEGYQSPMYCSW